MYPLRVQPIGPRAPTSVLLRADVVRYLADCGSLPLLHWIARVCPPALAVARAACTFPAGWPGDARLCGPMDALRLGVTSLTCDDLAREPLPPAPRADELKLSWPSDVRAEVVRVYDIDRQQPIPLVLTGTIFDVLI